MKKIVRRERGREMSACREFIIILHSICPNRELNIYFELTQKKCQTFMIAVAPFSPLGPLYPPFVLSLPFSSTPKRHKNVSIIKFALTVTRHFAAKFKELKKTKCGETKKLSKKMYKMK